MKLQASAVKQAALAFGIPVIQPQGLKLDGRFAADALAAQETIAAARLDVLVVAAYGLILPAWTLAAPRLGCLNIHASLLPRWRGAAPIHRAIESGDARTGITIMQMDAGLDTGDMLLRVEETIRPDDTTASLHDRLAALGGRCIVEAIAQAEQGGLQPVPQPNDGVTYAHKIAKEEGGLDWQASADLLARRVRAFDPFPGASTVVAGEACKVWAAEPGPAGLESALAAGTVISADAQGIRVACGQGTLLVLVLQRPGGRRISAREFLATRSLQAGDFLGTKPAP